MFIVARSAAIGVLNLNPENAIIEELEESSRSLTDEFLYLFGIVEERFESILLRISKTEFFFEKEKRRLYTGLYTVRRTKLDWRNIVSYFIKQPSQSRILIENLLQRILTPFGPKQHRAIHELLRNSDSIVRFADLTEDQDYIEITEYISRASLRIRHFISTELTLSENTTSKSMNSPTILEKVVKSKNIEQGMLLEIKYALEPLYQRTQGLYDGLKRLNQWFRFKFAENNIEVNQ